MEAIRGKKAVNACKSPNVATYRKETSLHRAWAGLQFERQLLQTVSGQPVRILNPGRINDNQGPDFLDAEIQIGDSRHFGHVELHIDADDWWRHGHQDDPHYNAVMLHVFLMAGRLPAKRADGTLIPELCLGDRVHPAPAPTAGSDLACGGLARTHLPPDPHRWLESAGYARIAQKAGMMRDRLRLIQYDWSRLLWEEVAASLGGPVNGLHFRQLANEVPWSLVQRLANVPADVAALLFGTVGLLEGRLEVASQRDLKTTWDFIRVKYRLDVRPIPFKFHRMHPSGFPTVRLAQLALLVVRFRPISQLIEVEGIDRFLKQGLGPADDGQSRNDFGVVTGKAGYELGVEARQRLVVNVLAPLAVLAGQLQRGESESSGQPDSKGGLDWKGIDLEDRLRCEEETPSSGGPDVNIWSLLRNIPPEQNKITRKFVDMGLKPRNALEAQGLIGIFKTRCMAFRCLECEIGRRAMRTREVSL